MRLKRSVMSCCPNCHERKGIDMRIDWGGRHYCNLYLVACECCDVRTKYQHTTKEALEAWELLVKEYK